MAVAGAAGVASAVGAEVGARETLVGMGPTEQLTLTNDKNMANAM